MGTVVHSQKQQSNNNWWYCGRPGMVTMTARSLNANYHYKSGSLTYTQRWCELRILQSDLRRTTTRRSTAATGGRSGARFSVVEAKIQSRKKNYKSWLTYLRGAMMWIAHVAKRFKKKKMKHSRNCCRSGARFRVVEAKSVPRKTSKKLQKTIRLSADDSYTEFY
jgi:hypothetical protein